MHTHSCWGHMLNKILDTYIMTSNNRHIAAQIDFTTGFTRLDQQCSRTRAQKTDKEEEIKISRFAVLKISADTHLAHLQSHASQPTVQALQKSAIWCASWRTKSKYRL